MKTYAIVLTSQNELIENIQNLSGREYLSINDERNAEIDHKGYSDIPEIKKPQVDFEMLKDTLENISTTALLDDFFECKEQTNLYLFFDMLSKSSSFAHKAHKELNRLKKQS